MNTIKQTLQMIKLRNSKSCTPVYGLMHTFYTNALYKCCTSSSHKSSLMK